MLSINAVANGAIISGVLSLFCLMILHVVSPEYKPAWRMISEYALGKHKWLLTSFFVLWAITSILTAILITNVVSSTWTTVGVILVIVSGVGALMGGLFDVKHKLHGVSFGLGVPTLPLGALLITYNLINLDGWNNHSFILLLFTHAIWISLIVMAITMMILFTGFKRAGYPVGPDMPPPTVLPSGVIGLNGYANRLLVICYIGWLLMICTTYTII